MHRPLTHFFGAHPRGAGQVSTGSVEGGFGAVFLHAVFAGWLIALMVWLLPAAESARVSIIVIVTYLIGFGGFNHVIAGSTKVMYLVVSHDENWAHYVMRFFLPTLIGNIVGGASLTITFYGLQSNAPIESELRDRIGRASYLDRQGRCRVPTETFNSETSSSRSQNTVAIMREESVVKA